MKEKMNGARMLLIGMMIIILIAAVYWLIHDRETAKVISTPLNQKVDLSKVFEEIEKIDGMKTWIPEDIPSFEELPSGEQEKRLDESEIDFGKYEVLEKKAIINTSEEIVNEVWMIKLGSLEQQEDIARILGNRLQKLRDGFEENEQQSLILKSEIIKQEDGIMIMILSPQAREIEKVISNEMK